MWLDALIAYLHFATIIGTGGIIIAQLLLYRRELDLRQARLLQKLDQVYPIAAILVVATGAARLFWFAKGLEFYAYNPVFYVLLGMFVLVGLLSIIPTRHFLSWRQQIERDGAPMIDEATYRKIHRILMAETHLYLLIPLMATLMARGIGG